MTPEEILTSITVPRVSLKSCTSGYTMVWYDGNAMARYYIGEDSQKLMLRGLKHVLEDIKKQTEALDKVYILNLNTKFEYWLSKAQLMVLIHELEQSLEKNATKQKIDELQRQLDELKESLND